MKSILFLALLFSISIGATAQISKFEAKDTTNILPEGLYLSNGKVMLQKGYTTKPSKNGKVIAIMKMGAGNSIKGGFYCLCSESGTSGYCIVSSDGGSLNCSGTCGCKLTIILADLKVNMARTIEEDPTPQKGWKVFVLPKKN